jgi:hypothetical protein
MAAPNLFEELKEALTKFKDFLDENTDTIKPAIQALASIVPKITELIDSLIELMGKLKNEIDKLNPGVLGDSLTKITQFTGATKTLLETAKGLLDDDKAINEVLEVVDIVSSLPSLDAIKDEIKQLIDSIVANLNKLKS